MRTDVAHITINGQPKCTYSSVWFAAKGLTSKESGFCSGTPAEMRAQAKFFRSKAPWICHQDGNLR
jgi:hypothetical protein